MIVQQPPDLFRADPALPVGELGAAVVANVVTGEGGTFFSTLFWGRLNKESSTSKLSSFLIEFWNLGADSPPGLAGPLALTCDSKSGCASPPLLLEIESSRANFSSSSPGISASPAPSCLMISDSSDCDASLSGDWAGNQMTQG